MFCYFYDIALKSELGSLKQNVATLSKCQIMDCFHGFVHILLTSGSFGVCFDLIFLFLCIMAQLLGNEYLFSWVFITGIYIYLSIICKYVYFWSPMDVWDRGSSYCGLLELSVISFPFKVLRTKLKIIIENLYCV